jgi:prepilin-type processing-associated H-X9-DG protein
VKKLLVIFLGVTTLLVVLECMGVPMQPALVLLFGWAPYLTRTLPSVAIDWSAVAGAALCLALLSIGGHLFLSWLYREMRNTGAASTPGRWKKRWTTAGLAIVVLMFASGIAATGITHQMAWLVNSPRSNFGYIRERSIRIKCASNMRQIGQGIALYAQDFGGRFPDDLSLLVIHAHLNPEVFTCPASNEEKATGQSTEEVAANSIKREHCSVVYLGKGLTWPADDKSIVAYEYDENHEGDGMNILFADGVVEWFTLEAAHAKMAAQQAQPPAKQP